MDFFIEQNRSTRAEKRFLYLNYVKPMVDREALFADGTEEYVKMSGGKATLRFRTAKNNVETVGLCIGESMTPMKRVESQGLFDYYQIEINCPEEGCAYYFRIQSGKIVVYYNKRGAMNEHQDY